MGIVGQYGRVGLQRVGGDEDILCGQDDALAIERPGKLGGSLPDLIAGLNEDHDRERCVETSQYIWVATAPTNFEYNHPAGGNIAVVGFSRDFSQRVTTVAQGCDVEVAVREQEVCHRAQGFRRRLGLGYHGHPRHPQRQGHLRLSIGLA